METVFYNLDARQVSTCSMASGESAPACRSYAVLRKVEARREGAKVLNMAAYRCKLAEEVAPAALPQADDVALPARTRSRHTRLFGLSLDFFATAAILVMATVVVASFLPFL